jgi:hypothetical protein
MRIQSSKRVLAYVLLALVVIFLFGRFFIGQTETKPSTNCPKPPRVVTPRPEDGSKVTVKKKGFHFIFKYGHFFFG